MDSTALYNAFSSEVRDEVAPYLWSDTEVYGYMDAAQKMFCRLQGGIADATSALTQLAVVAGDEYINISPLILKIRSARRLSDGRKIEILNFEDLESDGRGDDYGLSTGFRLDNTPGEVRAIVTGMSANAVRLVQIPTDNFTMSLIVYRMPLLTISGAGQAIEIDEQHHRYLLYWMKHLAHEKQDAETYDRGQSEMFAAQFRQYCDQAKAERERREHKYRTVAYGGL